MAILAGIGKYGERNMFQLIRLVSSKQQFASRQDLGMFGRQGDIIVSFISVQPLMLVDIYNLCHLYIKISIQPNKVMTSQIPDRC